MNFSKSFLRMKRMVELEQTNICSILEQEESKIFQTESWKRDEGGGGITRVLQHGSIFEKAGVNTSCVYGILPDVIAQNFNVEQQNFFACGLSIVIHPLSPRIPTIHMNVRYFELENGTFWYGGGIDLTPYFPHKEDFIFFHTELKNICDSIDSSYYPDFKKQCDTYFYIPHRHEMRGIGGVFFDYLKEEKGYLLSKQLSQKFPILYQDIIKKRQSENFTEDEKKFQLFRRGRYIEFNLIYDKGTLFGLKTNGRVESILMSLPLYAKFEYGYQPPKDNKLLNSMMNLYQPKNWIVNSASE